MFHFNPASGTSVTGTLIHTEYSSTDCSGAPTPATALNTTVPAAIVLNYSDKVSIQSGVTNGVNDYSGEADETLMSTPGTSSVPTKMYLAYTLDGSRMYMSPYSPLFSRANLAYTSS